MKSASEIRGYLLLGLLPLVLDGGRAWAATPAEARAAEAEECLACHNDDTATLTLKDGEEASMFVDRRAISTSVHKDLSCTECHSGFAEVPHPEHELQSLTEFHTTLAVACQRCHADQHRKTQDSVHQRMQGRDAAPTCVRCHGGHDVGPATEPRSRISRTCGSCHRAVVEAYGQSIHGKALSDQANPDVPVCTDCHRSHDIADPKQHSWLIGTPSLCGRCHADATRMRKYGLSTAVLSTYLADFHGTTTSFGSKGHTQGQPIVALCVDCHGVHDIGRVTGASAPAFRANLVKTCRRCHPGASTGFPAAWLSHYEPSLERAPLVFLVKRFCLFFIVLVLGGLGLQILLRLYRKATD